MGWTHRDRVLAALNHEETDRVPIDLGGTHGSTMHLSAYERFKKHLGLEHESVMLAKRARTTIIDDSILRMFDVDTRYLGLHAAAGGGFAELDDDTFRDDWGTLWRRAPDGHYIPSDGPFFRGKPTIADLESYPWPDPDDPGIYRGLAERAAALRRNTDCAIVLNLPVGVIHQGQWIRDFGGWLKDLYKHREFACRLMDITADYWIRVMENALETVGGNVDAVFFADDMAMQQGPLFDPQIYRQLIKPRHRRMVAAAKARGDVKVVFHSCGAVAPLIEDLIEVGVDAINPIQPAAKGMEPERLKRDFGDRIAFWGGICTQTVLPHGDVDDVRATVRQVIEALRGGGGFVLTSAHNVQPDVPPENVVAMLEEARSYGSPPGNG